MNSRQCEAYLQGLQKLGIKLGLENIKTVLRSLDCPHQKYPAVHVAGTNGKGSVCAMLAEILSGYGLKVGLYTSPHLVRIEERIQVGRRLVPGKDFRRLLGTIKGRIDRLLAQRQLEAHPTFFEVLTILAFMYFAERKIDVAVIEVGMGGRFDATNVVTPLVSVITTVSWDHQEYLGRTLGQIAFEKAGIIKPKVPAVCGLQAGEAYRVIKKRAADKEAPLLKVFSRPRSFTAQKKRDGYRFFYKIDGSLYCYSPWLQGVHQGRNAAIAIAAASVLSKTWRKLDKKKIIQGIEHARWPGRLEVVSRHPLTILDGAHNESGARTVRRFMRDFGRRPRILVFAMMHDKDIRKVMDILFPPAQKIILTSIPYVRAASPDEILSLAGRFKRKIILEISLKKAMAAARALAGSRGTVLVTGSLFLVGETKKLLP
jgi:dihydrofolate synthase/folylpolyglutamate synthase